MLCFLSFLAVLALAACAQPQSPPDAEPDTERNAAPLAIRLDGRLAPGEWDDGETYALRGGGEARIMADAERVYVAVGGDGFGWSHVYIVRGDTLRVLHASAALGTATYARAGDAWTLAQPFTWAVRDTTFGEAAEAERAAFFDRHGWIANTNMMGTRQAIEFQIARRLFDADAPKLALLFAEDPAAPLYWPHTLSDATLDAALIRGDAPFALRFDVQAWAMLPPAAP